MMTLPAERGLETCSESRVHEAERHEMESIKDIRGVASASGI
jgi:hypothetical protein